MVAGRGKNRKDSRRKAEPDPTSIQPPGLAEAPRAQSPEETTEPKEVGPVESAPPVEHRRRGVIRVRPSQRPKPNIKAVTAPPKAGAEGAPSRLTQSSSQKPQTGATKFPDSKARVTRRKTPLQPRPAGRSGKGGQKSYPVNDSPSFSAESVNRGVHDITVRRSHRNVPPQVEPTGTTPRRGRKKVPSTSIEALHATLHLPTRQDSPNLMGHLTEPAATEPQHSQDIPSIPNPPTTLLMSSPPVRTPRPFVFQDPFYDPPPPIPEGHKLVHLVRHCRAWHKYKPLSPGQN